MKKTVTARANSWIVGSRCGMSSKAIWAHMMDAGRPREGWSHPWDPDDLSRCLLLLKAVPEWAPRMPEMARRSKAWAGLIAHWDEIVASMKDEVGIDWSKGQNAPRTYDLMKAAYEGAR